MRVLRVRRRRQRAPPLRSHLLLQLQGILQEIRRQAGVSASPVNNIGKELGNGGARLNLLGGTLFNLAQEKHS